jgi:hypothetical protein
MDGEKEKTMNWDTQTPIELGYSASEDAKEEEIQEVQTRLD